MSDEQIVEYLRSRGRVTPPQDLVVSVMDAVAETPQRRVSWLASFVPAAVALAAAAAVVMLAFLIGQSPNAGPPASGSPPSTIDSRRPPTLTPSARPSPGEALSEPGDVVLMPALDTDGEWGTIRLERGGEIPVEPRDSRYEGGSFLVEIRVTYTAERQSGGSFGYSFDWGMRVEGGIPGTVQSPGGVLPAAVNPEREDRLHGWVFALEGSTTDGWIAVEVPNAAADRLIYLAYLAGSAGEPNVDPAWEVVVRQADSAPLDGDLVEAGNRVAFSASGPDGEFGTITVERGEDVGGYPLVPEPSSETHFFIELLVTYELDRAPEGADWGELDWSLEGTDGSAAEQLSVFPPPDECGGFGQWPGATVPEDRYEGCIVFAIARESADADLELVYRPSSAAEPLQRIPVRRPGPAPAPVAAAWPRPDPVYVAKPELPFTVLESAEADALFADADSCTNPEGGYTVSFPEAWYTNTAIGDVPACSWFSPVFYEVDDPGRVPDEIAIVLSIFEGGIGQIPEWPRTLSEEVRISGVDGSRHEDTIPSNPPDNAYGYAAWLDDDYLGRKLTGTTTTMHGEDYGLNKAVLDRIMASLVLTRPTGALDTFTPPPNPDADALFALPNECSSGDAGYVVEYPDAWFTNEAGDPAAADPDAACTHFVPEPIDEGVLSAIVGRRIESSSGSYGQDQDRQFHTIAGRPAVRVEYRGAAGEGGVQPPDWRQLVWLIQLGPVEETGPNLVFSTSTDDAGEYELNKAVLDRMMASIRIPAEEG